MGVLALRRCPPAAKALRLESTRIAPEQNSVSGTALSPSKRRRQSNVPGSAPRCEADHSCAADRQTARHGVDRTTCRPIGSASLAIELDAGSASQGGGSPRIGRSYPQRSIGGTCARGDRATGQDTPGRKGQHTERVQFACNRSREGGVHTGLDGAPKKLPRRPRVDAGATAHSIATGGTGNEPISRRGDACVTANASRVDAVSSLLIAFRESGRHSRLPAHHVHKQPAP
jgi:hypothetical protein